MVAAIIVPLETRGNGPANANVADALFEALWGRVLAAWDDEKTHHAILDYALQRECLAELAGRYRSLADDAEKGELAKKKLSGVVIAATNMLDSMKTPRNSGIPLNITLTAAAIAFMLVGWVAVLVFKR